jgi:hypothetical protein
MSTIGTNNYTTDSYPEPHDCRAIGEAMAQWIGTRSVPEDYLRSIFGGSFTTTDAPFGWLMTPSKSKMEALNAGLRSAKAGEIVDLGSFARYADDDVDEG